MEYLLYLLTGLLAAFLGALPPGAVNLSVVYTTLNQGAKQSTPIILAAAIGEIVLSLFALHCTMVVEEYFQKNIVIQYTIAIILILAGIFLLFQKKKEDAPKNQKKNKGFLKGLLLAILNPPVLVFWLVAFSFISGNTTVMVNMGFTLRVVIFFLGVFVGKILALWVYLQLSKKIATKARNITHSINKGIAILLALLGIFQLIKLG